MKILVQGATLTCSHQGRATATSGNPKLKIGGKPVLVQGAEGGLTFVGCPFATGGGSSPCTVTSPATAGVSMKVKVDGMGVLLETATGPAVNANDPSATWSVSDAGQTLAQEN